jgi:hypothetical protein
MESFFELAAESSSTAGRSARAAAELRSLNLADEMAGSSHERTAGLPAHAGSNPSLDDELRDLDEELRALDDEQRAVTPHSVR